MEKNKGIDFAFWGLVLMYVGIFKFNFYLGSFILGIHLWFVGKSYYDDYRAGR